MIACTHVVGTFPTSFATQDVDMASSASMSLPLRVQCHTRSLLCVPCTVSCTRCRGLSHLHAHHREIPNFLRYARCRCGILCVCTPIASCAVLCGTPPLRAPRVAACTYCRSLLLLCVGPCLATYSACMPAMHSHLATFLQLSRGTLLASCHCVVVVRTLLHKAPFLRAHHGRDPTFGLSRFLPCLPATVAMFAFSLPSHECLLLPLYAPP